MKGLLDFQSFVQENCEVVAHPGFWNNHHHNRGHGSGSIPTNPGN